MSSYTLTADNKKITWGTSVEIAPLLRAKPSILTVQEDGSVDWRLAEGVYVAKDIVRELDILLEAVLLRLGEAADHRLLLDNLQANLAIEGREADLPLGQLELTGKAGVEVTRQARQIGEKLSLWAREYNVEKSAARQHDPQTLGNVYFRSHCENHLWTHRVADLLMGPAGGPVVMQMFNEYLHQFILLRDALLPFENWEEVPIEIRQGAGSDRGVRFIEQPRAKFLTAIMSKKITHKALVEYAQGWLSPELSAVGYGFQYRLGTILPASLNGHPGTAPGYLLQWYPVWTVLADAAGAAVPVAFRYGEEEYFAAPRSQVLAGKHGIWLSLIHSNCSMSPKHVSSRLRFKIVYSLTMIWSWMGLPIGWTWVKSSEGIALCTGRTVRLNPGCQQAPQNMRILPDTVQQIFSACRGWSRIRKASM